MPTAPRSLPDYYAVLGIPADSSAQDIARAYRALALLWHPDRVLPRSVDAQQRFQNINEAYHVLKSPERRARYDLLRESFPHNRPRAGNDNAWSKLSAFVRGNLRLWGKI